MSFEDITKLLGIEGMNIGTYVSTNKPDGSLHGEGQGVFATADGDVATWRGMGAGRLQAGGAVSYRGMISYSTASAKLTSLNAMAGVFEFEVDAQREHAIQNLGMEVAGACRETTCPTAP